MIYIVGPTSSGKTSLAIELCKRFNGEIISADSRQVFKNFNVGTGKLPVNLNGLSASKNSSFWTLDGIKIHMYDVCDANSMYTVSDYLNDIKSLIGEDKIVVGGTGLYIDNLLGLKKPSPVPPDMKIRNELKNMPSSELRLMLPKEILDTMNQSDRNNPRRLIRKIEIEQSPKALVEPIFLQDKDPRIIILDLPREELFIRVDVWVEEIWNDLVIETKKLIDLGYEDSSPMKGIIYKTALAYIKSEISKIEAVQKIKHDLHAYIRRQQTWFKKYSGKGVVRVKSRQEAVLVVEAILAKSNYHTVE